MLCDTLEHVAQIGFRIDVVELGGTEEGVQGGSPIATIVRSREEPVLAAQSDDPKCPLRRIVVDLEPSVLAIACERDPVRERIANRFGKFPLLRQRGRCLMQPLVQGLELGSCTCLAHCVALMRLPTTDLLFDFVQSPDPLKGFKGDRRAKRYM